MKKRYKRWVDSSYFLYRIEALLPGNLQGLGLLDVELIKDFPKLRINSSSSKNRLKKLRHITLSELWLMGAYHLVSLVDSIISERKDLFEDKTIKEAKRVKKRFSEIRNPVVKFKRYVPRGGQPIYSGIPWVEWSLNKGFAYKVYITTKDDLQTRIVSRIDLSNLLLNLFEKLTSDIIRKEREKEEEGKKKIEELKKEFLKSMKTI